MKDPEDIFHDSKGNDYDITDESDEDAINKIDKAANYAYKFMGTNGYNKVGKSTYEIENQKYQSVKYIFKMSKDNSCKLEISTPFTFEGEVRMWVTNNEGDRVWANVYDLEYVDFTGEDLFVYLGGEYESESDHDQRRGYNQVDVAQFFGEDVKGNETDERSQNNSSKSDDGNFEPSDELPF